MDRSAIAMSRSRPARGAWIETQMRELRKPRLRVSRPARGAWIETIAVAADLSTCERRAPRGARGLKLAMRPQWQCKRRAPRGARGLKHTPRLYAMRWRMESRPARGAWIETARSSARIDVELASRPARGAWIETRFSSSWIESDCDVAPRAGRVD